MGSNPIEDARQNGAVGKRAKRRSSNLRDRLWVRLPPVLLEQHASAGHWRAQVAVTHPLSSFGGSTPSRRTNNTARSSNGRMRDTHSRDTGSTPVRVTDIAKWRYRYTRDSQNVVSTWTCEFDSRLGYLQRNDCRCGRCPTGFHKAGEPGSIPGSATAGGPVLSRAS